MNSDKLEELARCAIIIGEHMAAVAKAAAQAIAISGDYLSDTADEMADYFGVNSMDELLQAIECIKEQYSMAIMRTMLRRSTNRKSHDRQSGLGRSIGSTIHTTGPRELPGHAVAPRDNRKPPGGKPGRFFLIFDVLLGVVDQFVEKLLSSLIVFVCHCHLDLFDQSHQRSEITFKSCHFFHHILCSFFS